MKRVLLFSVAILGFAGCKNNPYPDGIYSPSKTPQHEVQQMPSLIVPSKVAFSEGLEGSFTIQATLPGSATPLVTIDGLPQGAVFSPQDNKVTWKPGYDQGNDPNNPQATYRTYTLLVALSDSANVKVILQQEEVTLIVNDTPRSFKLIGLSPADNLYEGTDYIANFTVQSDDFPQGPFSISLKDAIPGTVVTQSQGDPTSFQVALTPGFDLVKWDYLVSSKGYLRSYNWSMTVTDPKLRVLNVPITWNVRDSRQDAKYVGPSSLAIKSNDFEFLFIVKDPNFEGQPLVSVAQTQNGNLTIDPVAQSGAVVNPGEMPTQIYHGHWTNIPQVPSGTTEDVDISMCVHNTADNELNNCSHATVTATFDIPAPPPVPPTPPAASPTPDPTPEPTPAALLTLSRRGVNL